MSGTTDYTQTPNLGLYKPIFNRAVGTWGDLWNSNADTLDAAARNNNVANVLDFGADPNNATDSTAAFNAAASQTNSSGRSKAVYVPAGSYRIDGTINLTAGQAFYGDSMGTSVLIISQTLSSSATCIINITLAGGDPGPYLHDFGITFVQPLSGSSRANYKTIAAGGTVTTGIAYPWAISANNTSGRVLVENVRISGAWDGITTNGNNVAFWMSNVQIGALDCGMSLGEGASQVLDFAKFSSIEFWPFGCDQNLFMDGHTIAMRVGGQNGLEAHGISCFTSRMIFTSQATNCWAAITNLALDGDGATLEIAAGQFIQITNLYSSCSPTGVGRPAVSIAGGISTQIANWWSSNQSSQPHLSVTGNGVDVVVTGGMAAAWNNTVSAFVVGGGALLRLSDMRIDAAVASAYTQPLVQQQNTGVLQVNNLAFTGKPGGSGTAIQMSADNAGNVLGNAISLAAGWANSVVGGPNGNYGALPLSGGTMSGGLTTRGGITMQSASTTTASFLLQTTGNGADQNLWDSLVSTTSLEYRAINDAVSAANTWMQVDRSGYAINQISLGSSGADTIIGRPTGNGLTATRGFLNIPFCAGTPTGVPANNAKGIPMQFDVSTNKLWAYVGGAWKASAAFT